MTPDNAESNTASRRAVLLGAGGAGAAAVLAACVSTGPSSTSTRREPLGAPSGSAGTDLGPVTGVPVGGGKIFVPQQTVVTQPTAGAYKAFTTICTHMHCTVGSVSGGTINCPCHGSRYSITDGSVINGPAPRPLAAKPITVTDGDIHLG